MKLNSALFPNPPPPPNRCENHFLLMKYVRFLHLYDFQISKALYIAKDVKKGDLVTIDNLKSVRPGYGMHPKNLPNLLGKKFKMDCKKGTRVSDILFE